MAGRDRLYQGISSMQASLRGYIDDRTPEHHHAQSSSTAPLTSRPPESAADPVPTYAPAPRPGDEAVPADVLNAPPGQAQSRLDSQPRNQLLRATDAGDARAARRAALELAKQQKRGDLRTKHAFTTSSGKVVLDIDTPPQRILTFMGGTRERGTGAIQGRVTLHTQENERVSAVRVKVKATVRVKVPKESSPQHPMSLAGVAASQEPSTEKEELLLQLEASLFQSSTKEGLDLRSGTHTWGFKIDLPAETKAGPLPPSFVLEPDVVDNAGRTPASRPPPGQQPASAVDRGKAALSLLSGAVASLPLVGQSKEWASVKYYIKVTVERPGMLRPNDRIFAPFVYLPPPLRQHLGGRGILETRARLGWEATALLRRLGSAQGSPWDERSLESLCIPLSQWIAYDVVEGGAASGHSRGSSASSSGQGFLSKLWKGTGSSKNNRGEDESWSLLLPPQPPVFPLRSSIPFVLRRQMRVPDGATVALESEGDLRGVPLVTLYQRTFLYGRASGPTAAFYMRPVSQPVLHPRPTALAPVRGDHAGPVVLEQLYLGSLDAPSSCAPSFEAGPLRLEYLVGVKRRTAMAQQGGQLDVIVPVQLSCAPPGQPTVSAAASPHAGGKVQAPAAVQPPLNAVAGPSSGVSAPPPPPRPSEKGEKAALAAAEQDRWTVAEDEATQHEVPLGLPPSYFEATAAATRDGGR